MRTCYVIPGFAGSELHFAPPRVGTVYANPVSLFLGGLPGMSLSPNGLDPFNGPDWAMVSGPALPDYFGDLVNTLTAELGPHGYQVVNWGWDWRQSLVLAGAALANRIRADATPAEPAAIVCHSTGGLVARRAWFRLGQTGQQNLLRRIVTLGTPHRGTYAPVRVFSHGDPTITRLRETVNTVLVVGGPLGVLLGSQVPTHQKIAQIFATFPCLYDLFPLVDAESQLNDPDRPHLFNVNHWPAERELSAAHMADANNVIQPWMRDPASMPPAAVLTTIAGTGFATPFRLLNKGKLGEMQAMDLTLHGDATVPLESALVAGRPQVVLHVEHHNLTLDPRVLGRVAGWVLAERDASTPLPPALNIPGVPATFALPPPSAEPPETVYVDPEGNILPDPGSNLPPGGVFPGQFRSSFGGVPGMPFHVSFEFKQEVARTGGWSENYWNTADSVEAVRLEAVELAHQLQRLHGRTSVLRHIRVANASPAGPPVPVARRSKLFVFQKDVNDKPPVGAHSDYPTTALNVKLSDGADLGTTQWIRGFRDAFTDEGGFLMNADPNFVAAFGNFRGALIAGNMHWVVRVLDPVNAQKVVLSISAAGVVKTQGAHGFAVGNKVRIRNCQVNKYPNKVWRISLGAANDEFTLNNWNPPLPFVPVQGENITARLQGYTYIPVKQVEAIYATKKNVGKPLGLLGGRPKKRR